jgi:hypothetical protein
MQENGRKGDLTIGSEAFWKGVLIGFAENMRGLG